MAAVARIVCFLALLVAPTVAFAQDAASAGEEDAEEEAPTHVPATWHWPRSAHVFRGLPPCEPGQLIPARGTGESYTCHPPFRDPGLEVQSHFHLSLGVGYDRAANVDRQFGGGFELSLWPTRWLGVGAEWLATRSRGTAHDTDGDGVVDQVFPNLRLHAFSGKVLFRHYLNEASRSSIGLQLNAGYAISVTDRAPGHPVIGGGLTLSRGSMMNGDMAYDVELGLRYLQGLGGDGGRKMRSVLLTLGFGFANRAHAPRNFHQPRINGPFRFAMGLVMAWQPELKTSMAAEMALGLNVHPLLEPRIRAELGAYTTDDARSEDRTPFSRFITGSLGLRLYLARLPLYLEVGSGAIGIYGDTPREIGPGAFVDARIGAIYTNCNGGGLLYFRYRAGVAGEYRGEHQIALTLEWTLGNYDRRQAYRRQMAIRQACPGTGGGANPVPPAPPPEPEPEPQPETPSAELDAGGSVEVELPDVSVEVEPVSVEVVLGYVLFGGAVDMRIDVRSLPIAQLREAGWVSVEIVGPPAARARARAELNAILDREGITVNAETEAEGEGAAQAVKARFTIWPPGTRPRD